MTQTVVITGANRGIGLELVKCYLGDGDWHIVATCRTPEKADALKSLADDNPNVEIATLDVSNGASVANFAKYIGNKTVDVLVNNAGVIGGDHQSFGDIDFDAWIETFTINTLGPVRVSQALIENVRKSDNGKIVTISSQMGALGRESRGSYAYRSTKAAVNKAMQTLSVELRDENIAVTLYHPGWVKTDMGGSGAEITPQESAAGLFKCFSQLTLANSGKFFKWNGEPHVW
ncbi:SDR family oxidoreductase [Maritalea sp.]|uniref:SDR family oxidoreductase n=1 Tax=Maritalea sp. TaxID=2003361 RepID=UPI003EF4C122